MTTAAPTLDSGAAPEALAAALRRVERDLDPLGEWLPLLDGTALPLPDGDGPPPRTGYVDAGRPHAVAEAHPGLCAALRALHRLEALAVTDARAVAVLWYAFVQLGPGARAQLEGARYDAAAGEFGAYTDRRGLARRLGLLFAAPASRVKWFCNLQPAAGRAAAVAFGGQELARAVEAYLALPRAAGEPYRDRPRLSTARLRDALGRLDAERRRHVAELRRAAGLTRARGADPDAPLDLSEVAG
jgi:hypothetical protein